MKKQPPKFLLTILNWFCHPDFQKFVEGDLIEIFQYNLKTKGVRQANWIFANEIFKVIRPSLMKSMEGSYRLNYYGIFKNHIKTSLRNIQKHALFSAINIAGLAISMSVGVLVLLFHSELSSFDDFHQNKDRIFRVTSSYIGGSNNTQINRPTASCFIGNELKKRISGVEEVTVLIDDMTADLLANEEGMSIEGFYASPSFFEVFTFELEQGNPASALKSPNSVVLTSTSAKKIFGEKNPIGKAVAVFKNQYTDQVTVTGVIEDLPLNSHLRFDALLSFSTLESHASDPYIQDLKNDPGELSDANVYVLLDEFQKPEIIDQVMASAMIGFNETIEHPITHSLQPMKEFVTSDTFRGSVGPTFSQTKAWVMMGLALIVLLSACFNYTNLSLARAVRRTKEVGIRKANGASKSQIFVLFIIEAVLLSTFSLIIGLMLFYVIRPEFLKLPIESARGFQMFTLTLGKNHLATLFGFAVLIGILAGVIPALFHSKMQVKNLFYTVKRLKLYKGITVRTFLISTQFALSIGLITAAILIKNQYEFVLNYDHGYETDNILSVAVEGDYIDLLENGCEQLSEVTDISKSSWILGVGGKDLQLAIASTADGVHSTPFLMNQVNRNYLAMHEISLLEGGDFSKDMKEGEQVKEIIVNEAFLEALSLGSAEEALGKQVQYYGKKLSIVGICEEVVSIGLNKKLFEPFAFVQAGDNSQFTSLHLKVRTTDLLATIRKIEEVYEPLDPIHPFQTNLYEDLIAKGYETRRGNFRSISFLALLAIIISTLGMLGMAVYTVENRMKEISIRKVLGAGKVDLSYLLSKSYFIMIGVAGLIAIPLTTRIADQYLLNDFWDRATIGVVEVLSGFIIVFLSGSVIIAWQLQQVMDKNPADLLRDE